jgi:hypothetical protein
LEVPKQYFSSRAGYDDLVKQLGGNKGKAPRIWSSICSIKRAQDLTTPKELNNWLKDPKNGWVDNIQDYANKLKESICC